MTQKKSVGKTVKAAFASAWRSLGRAVPATVAPWLVLAGGLGAVASGFMAWTGSSDFPGDLTVNGYPAGLQWITIAAGVLVAVFALPALKVPYTSWLAPRGTRKAIIALAFGALAASWYTAGAITKELGGLANLDPGALVAVLATLLAVVGAAGLPEDQADARDAPRLPAWLDIVIISAVMYGGMRLFTYGLDITYSELFIGFLLAVGFGVWGLVRSGLASSFSAIIARNRSVAALAALVAALLFPFTQASDQYTSIGANILVFATVALGLNIVVGLAGLLDLGYVAFLGVGAYAAALVSGSIYSKFKHTVMPFWAAVLIGVAAALVAGVIIGAPTLRLRGDYLAIVTLGFGEIFRITVNRLDGHSGPQLTNGPQGIPAIPELNLFGYDFGKKHVFFGHEFGKFSNYYLLLVFLIAFVVFIFTRVNDSRIGRAWVAIREDETAATAMGINGFRFKLLAFGLGASLAGLAGTVQAHVTTTVTPDQYQFAGTAPPNSAFLLAAVVLGGMGTVTGPMIGAALLYLIPAKLEFLGKYELLGFGLALILMMRFRPEGIVPSRRRQLEFHEEEVSAAEAHAVAEAELAGA